MKADGRFRIAFLVVTLLIAGGVSYLASSSPDGLDSATLRGCQIVEHDGAEQLSGQCIARNADDHALADSPLADYAVTGAQGSGGLAGVIGVAVTLAAAGALFWALSRGRAAANSTADPGA